MKTKDGVYLGGLDPVMRPALIAADVVWKAYGQELVITSTDDGVHSSGSLHPFGKAIDLRTYYFNSKEKKLKVCEALQVLLGISFTVILKDTHIHVEYDLDKKYLALFKPS
jgi:hypothetical protein